MKYALSHWWNDMWKLHQQAKDLLSFFVSGNTGSSFAEKNQKEDDNGGGEPPVHYKPAQKIGLWLGPLLFALTMILFNPETLSSEGQAILASTIWIATWWISEAIPIPVTSLLPIVLFPITGGLDLDATTSSYGSDTIFLFMGGFIIALAMERWNLHKRIALAIISAIGTNTERIILGFMVATGFLSMWISNTATAMMMVPIGLAIIYQVADSLKNDPIDTSKENFNFGKALMLGIAYSASIGGLGTLIGTPPNTIFAGTIDELYGIDISFARWMLFGVPIAIVLMAIAWVYLVKVAYPMKLREIPGGRKVISEERKALGNMSYEEKAVMTVFVITALAWISRSFILAPLVPGIDDAVIAIAASIVLFIVPARHKEAKSLMNWDTAKELPWGILLLFGGGLAIAAGFRDSGLAQWIGEQLTVLEGVSFFIILLAVIALVIFLTEITSNTATATMMFPIMASLSVAINVHPYSLMIGAGVAASCAFMLPVATPPNAVVFGSGYLRIPDMAKAGVWLNIISIFILAIAVYFLIPLVWGITLTEFPSNLR
ncbi:DASS family sodium-coupled anion symporter [Halobacillus shinanisalinarum]|uniref:Sodium-dependent dicarboxylate transporter SdcS n=1 Tax=Halobacillus shinanisalinarum TaxID=2932258 RepID=A0ABY4H8T0_9BACI|nr:DASS family sodium-coupled anion symporter [Halobacillus shinanisalinarum]UOQ95392.1 DASS family sodium-coupled anion symporter [Halobacillus shinanisalinarum]